MNNNTNTNNSFMKKATHAAGRYLGGVGVSCVSSVVKTRNAFDNGDALEGVARAAIVPFDVLLSPVTGLWNTDTYDVIERVDELLDVDATNASEEVAKAAKTAKDNIPWYSTPTGVKCIGGAALLAVAAVVTTAVLADDN